MPDPNDFLRQEALRKMSEAGDRFNSRPDYNAPPDLEKDISSMPNAERLTPFERSVYKVLPGFSESGIGKALEKFSSSWAGRALNYLDIPAEGVERTIGLLGQLDSGGFHPDELKAAWYAGSLTYDYMNTPQLKRDANGKIVGLEIPDDLPDLAGLNRARGEIARLMSEGMDAKGALAQVREKYYTDLGALALRAQMHDAFFHAVADPSNYILPALRPIEALKVKSLKALTGAEGRIAYTAEQLTAEATKITKAATELAADATKAVESADDIAAMVRSSNLLTEAAAKVASGEWKGITTGDRIAIMLTGGDPFRPNKVAQKISNVPILNFMLLTPESKAKELMFLIGDNIGTNIVQRVWGLPDAERQFVQAVQRIGKGGTGIEFGHAMLSMEGRTVQGFVAGSAAKVTELFKNYEAFAPQRNFLTILSDTLGESGTDLLKRIGTEPGVVLQQILNKTDNPAIAALVQSGELTIDKLEGLRVLKGIPLSKQHFFAAAMDQIEEHAMRQAVTQFGVKARGVVTRWSDAVKSAEGLAFLRINPAYPIRNAINNDVTMIARGVFGMMTQGEIDNFWSDVGWLPARLAESFSPQLSGLENKAGLAEDFLEKALQGAERPGLPEKAKAFFRGIDLGKFDTAKAGRVFEERASKRAFTTGFIQYIRRYWKPQKVATYLDTATLDAIEQAVPGFTGRLDDMVRSSGAMQAKLDKLLGGNLNLNVDTVLDEASRLAGTDVRELMGDDVLEFLHKGLPDAIENGKVEAFVVQAKARINAHIEDLFQRQVENVTEHIAAKTQLGGPQVWYQVKGELDDMFWSAHIEHSQRSPELTRLAREAVSKRDFEKANALWSKIQEDENTFFNRAFQRMDAYMAGMQKGGVPMPGEVRQSFGSWRKMWEDFFNFRNTERRAFFDARLKGKPYKKEWDALNLEIDKRYTDAIAQEDELMRGIDDAVSGMIDDPARKLAFQNSRDVMGELRSANKEKIIEMVKRARELPADQRAAAWNVFQTEQQAAYEEMRNVDAASRAIMQGDERAMQMFSQAPAREPIQSPKLTPDQAKAVEMGVPEAQVRAEANPQGGGVFDPTQPYFDEAGNLVEPQKRNDILDIADELGIPTASPSGKRTDKRLLNIVNKYLKDNPPGSAAISGAEMGLPTGSPQKLIADAGGIRAKYFEEVMGGKLGKDTKGVLPGLFRKRRPQGKVGGLLASEDGMGLDEAGRLLAEHGYMSEDDAQDLNKVAEFIRNNKAPGGASASEGVTQFDSLEEAGKYPETVRKALEDWAQKNPGKLVPGKAKVQPAAPGATRISQQFMADLRGVAPDPMPIDLGQDLMAYGRTYGAFDHIVEAAAAQGKKAPAYIKQLPPELREKVMAALERTKSDMSSARYTATRFAEWRRDSALLNYNRRTHFDAFVGNMAPFAFWTTGSLQKWAVESIDRPAMFTTYLRMYKFLETSGLSRQDQPGRVGRGLRIKLPFAPDWLGEQFVDPMRYILPFDSLAQPIEQFQQNQMSLEGRAQRLLDSKLEAGDISEAEYKLATGSKSGPVWDRVVAEAQRNDEGLKYDAWDFATAMSSPHAPIMWAYNAARGHKEDIGPFAPASRLMRNAATLLGVKDWNNSGWNVEAKIRRQMGLPAFDKWDDYRVDRAISDLAGRGDVSVEDAQKAMYVSSLVQQGKISPDQAKQMSEVYAKGIEHANQEYTGGPAGAVLSMLGINVKSVPEGETQLRRLTDDFSAAFDKYNKANNSLEDFLASHQNMSQEDAAAAWQKANPQLADGVDALTAFFDKHPEYETRLGLFDKPEERVRKFMIDQVWTQYNSFPDLNKREIRDQLGNDFLQKFLDRNTRAYDQVTPEELSVWLKLMGGNPVGTLTAKDEALLELQGLKLTDPESANRAQVFYDYRKQKFANYYELQNGYYAESDKSKRKAYLKEHPDLQAYWDWRRDFMFKNPDLVRFLTDDPEAIKAAEKKYRQKGAVPTQSEIMAQIDPDMQELLQIYQSEGTPLPMSIERELRYIAYQQGLSYEQLLGIGGFR